MNANATLCSFFAIRYVYQVLEGAHTAHLLRSVKLIGIFDRLGSPSGVLPNEDIEIIGYIFGTPDLDVTNGAIAFSSGDVCVLPDGKMCLDAHIVSVSCSTYHLKTTRLTSLM